MGSRIKKGDKIAVISGKDKGKTGEILKVLPKKNKAIVQGINIIKRHTKPASGSPGGIIEKELPIDCSNILHVDPKTGNPTRIGFKTLDDGRKVRYAKKSGEIIDS